MSALDALLITLGVTEDPDDDWREQALCAQTSPEAFYPEKGESARPARSVCARCPVTQTCLQWAMDHHEPHGIWGGLSTKERRRLRAGQNPLDADDDDLEEAA